VLLRAVLLVAVVLAGALLVPDVRWQAWGRLRGEAFYQGRPTSYWRCELHALDADSGFGPATPTDRLKKAVGLPYRIGPASPLDGCSPAAVPVLVELMDDEDFRVQCDAADCLANLAPGNQDALSELVDLLRHGRTAGVRRAAARALEVMEPPTREAIPALQEALCDEDRVVRGYASMALGRLDQEALAQAGTP
jgi:hypothetical protein